jgi:predicted Zn-ribbon and HTH transcriptional regulator
VRHRTLALLTAILPAMWAVGRWRRRRTVAAGRCANCGYDLRATPDRCPECGATPTAPAEP